MIHIHKWSKWKTVDMIYTRVSRGVPVEFEGQEQRRECFKCGLEQSKRL